DNHLWFDDGNLILVAGNVEFCIYMGPLINSSPVFRDMLSLPQPTSDGESYACPVVQVPDHPNDIRCILQSLIFGNDLRFVAEHPSFDTISSIARMGHEYQIYNAVKYALTYLRCYYPSDYAGWKQNKRGAPNFRPAHSIGVMNLARLTQTSDIMPAAFWICCNLDIDHLQAGFKRNDGTVETLSRTDLVNVLIARQELA
ncbi:hypothetical protein DICSQDRAFT_35215, partial [Dichomitus squalens LYAD-421 SS1]